MDLLRAIGPPPWIVGHRGVPSEAPENTLASFRLAALQAADMVELDLHLAADGVLVACHEPELSGPSGGRLAVEEACAERLRAAVPALPTLGEILDALPASLPLNLELKRRAAAPARIVDALLRTAAGRARPILVSSFDIALLELVRSALPGLALAPLSARDPASLIAAGGRLAGWSLHASRRLATPWLAAAARRDGRPLLVYTVDDPGEARRLFAMGAAGVFSDRPGMLRRELGLTS